MKEDFIGKWKIVEMEQWDQDFVDMDSPGHVTFKQGGTGQPAFGCVEAELDWRFEAETERVEFAFSGFDEGDEVTGRGWAKADGARLTGRMVFQQGDESGFAAAKGSS